jgi:YfiH family protein
MFIHNTSDFVIYFGDAQNGISNEEYRQAYTYRGTIIPDACSLLKHHFSLNEYLFLRQTHSTECVIITEKINLDLIPFLHEGDFLLTDKPGLGLGILTADCLPIVIYDPIKHIIAIAHAGWRGSIAGIATIVIQAMKDKFNCRPEKLNLFFGPSAKGCCYTIDNQLIQQLNKHDDKENYLFLRNASYYFDLANFNRIKLAKSGIIPATFCFDYNICTICNPAFYSYRRQHQNAGRQITLVFLSS